MSAECRVPSADRLAIALIALALARVGIAIPNFSCTPDEPMHVAAGLQVITDHAYTIQLQNPPLVRIVLAIWPWLNGVHLDPGVPVFDQFSQLFHSGGNYVRDLSAARLTNLLFLLIASLATWLLGRRELGESGGA